MAISLERFVDSGELVASRQPKYARLKRFLIDEVAQGRILPGEALPTEREMAGTLQLALGTVRQALAGLEQDGVIRREQGRGTFVNENGAQDPLRPAAKSPATKSFAMLMMGTHDLSSMSMIRGFGQECQKFHHSMLLVDSNNVLNDQAAMILRLSQSDIGGIAIQPVTMPPTPSYHITALQEKQIPVVFCHRSVEGARGPLLSVSHEEEGRQVGRAFAEQGHRRVALLIAYQTGGIAQKWVRGMRESLRAVDGELPDEFIYSAETTSLDAAGLESNMSEALERMFRSENPPTALFVVPDDFAQERVLQQMGLRVPEDVSLIGLGDINRDSSFTRRLTSVGIDGAKLSRRAVELLAEMQSGERSIHDTEEFPMAISISDGQTLGPAPKSGRFSSK